MRWSLGAREVGAASPILSGASRTIETLRDANGARSPASPGRARSANAPSESSTRRSCRTHTVRMQDASPGARQRSAVVEVMRSRSVARCECCRRPGRTRPRGGGLRHLSKRMFRQRRTRERGAAITRHVVVQTSPIFDDHVVGDEVPGITSDTNDVGVAPRRRCLRGRAGKCYRVSAPAVNASNRYSTSEEKYPGGVPGSESLMNSRSSTRPKLVHTWSEAGRCRHSSFVARLTR